MRDRIVRAFCSCFAYYNQASTLTFQWVVRTMFMFYLVTPLNCSLLLWSFDQTWDWLRTSNVHVATFSNTSKFLKVFKEWRQIRAIMIIPKIWVVRTRWFMFDPEYQFALILSGSLVHSQRWILGSWIFRIAFSLFILLFFILNLDLYLLPLAWSLDRVFRFIKFIW